MSPNEEILRHLVEFKFHIGEKKDGVRSDSEMKAVVSLLRKMDCPVVPSFVE